jgi:hypothetical protein
VQTTNERDRTRVFLFSTSALAASFLRSFFVSSVHGPLSLLSLVSFFFFLFV